MWNGLRPSSQKVLSLVAELKTLQKNNETLEKDKEHLRINLLSAEEEVKLFFEENKVLDEANKRLLKQYRKERKNSGSDGKHTDVSTKSNKRKSSSKVMSSSPIQGRSISVTKNQQDNLSHPCVVTPLTQDCIKSNRKLPK